MRRALTAGLLGVGVWAAACRWLGTGSELRLRYVPTRAYSDGSIRPVVIIDDGSGERTVTREQMVAPPRAVAVFETRTSGTLRVRVHLLGSGGDTLASTDSRLPLEPDLVWEVYVRPGFVVDNFVAPQGRLDPGTYVAAPIATRGGGMTGDSLFVTWISKRRSQPSTT